MYTTTIDFSSGIDARNLTDTLEVLSVPFEREGTSTRVVVPVPEGVSRTEHQTAVEDIALTVTRGDFRIFRTAR